jgi:hypothetical protein
MIALKVIFLFLLADLGTGIFHFAADTYGKEDGKFMTQSVNFLLVHHNEPRKILEQSYWELTGGVYKVAILVFPISLLLGFSWELLLFLLFSANGNMIHKWAHQIKDNRSALVVIMQNLRLIQNPKQHMKHHDGYFNQNFCVMSNFLNPILTQLHIWQGVIIVLKLIGIKPNKRTISKL